MKCLSCKNDETIETTTAYFSNAKNCYVIIENVPCQKCSQCGEEFFSVDVMEKIDEIIAQAEKVMSKIFILDYKQAA